MDAGHTDGETPGGAGCAHIPFVGRLRENPALTRPTDCTGCGSGPARSAGTASLGVCAQMWTCAFQTSTADRTQALGKPDRLHKHSDDLDELARCLKEDLRPGDLLLITGSGYLYLGRLAAKILKFGAVTPVSGH